MVEAKAKAKATKICPRGVLEVEASPRGPPSLPLTSTVGALTVARAGAVGAGEVLRDGEEGEGVAYAAVSGLERS